MTLPSGLVIIDKPAGWTSHDVVARMRRLAGTRRVGHAGTLDPMATGVLVVGVAKATRLLGYLTLSDKDYDATIRLGQATDTGDAEGTVLATAVARDIPLAVVTAAAAALTGEIQQVPPAVSAIKVGGKRAYQLARAGSPPELPPRAVTVHAFGVDGLTLSGDLLDVDVTVTCSSGTYVRALARDMGQALGVGGHLTRLRRTRSGRYGLDTAHTLDELAALAPGALAGEALVPIDAAARDAFPGWQLTHDEARALARGARQPGVGLPEGPVAAFAPDGTFIALVERRDGFAKPLAVFAPSEPGTPAPGTPAPGTPAPGTPAPGMSAPGMSAPGSHGGPGSLPGPV